MSNELKIDKSKVLAAAEKCPQAKATLEVLFPEVFVKDNSISTRREDLEISDDPGKVDINTKGGIGLIRTGAGLAPANLANKCFWLTNEVKWEIKEHNGSRFLIPTYWP